MSHPAIAAHSAPVTFICLCQHMRRHLFLYHAKASLLCNKPESNHCCADMMHGFLSSGKKAGGGKDEGWRGLCTLREPPKRRQATASLILSAPKIWGAMRLGIRSRTLGCAANSLNSASSCALHPHPPPKLTTPSRHTIPLNERSIAVVSFASWLQHLELLVSSS